MKSNVYTLHYNKFVIINNNKLKTKFRFWCVYVVGGVGASNRFWYFSHMPLINVLADISSGARGLIFGLNLHLPPYFLFLCM